MMKTLFKDAHIVPMTQDGKIYSFMGICRGKIIYLGNDLPGEHYDRVISLGGRYVYPTLCDSHLHLLYSIVLSASSFNICRITEKGVVPDSLAGIEKSVRAYVSKNPGKGLIMINQYIPAGIREGRLPFSKELDEWTGGRETVIYTMDGHSCALSSSLAEKLGIQTQTGILSGADYDMIQGKITNYSASKVNLRVLAKGVANFTNECLKYGITKVCALDGDETGAGDKIENRDKESVKQKRKIPGGNDKLLSLLIFLARRMDIGVRLYPEYMDYRILDRVGKYMNRPRIGGCAKWELDGSVGSHSAAFYHPFRDTGTLGHTYYEDTYIADKVKEGLSRELQMTCHSIGTKAIDQITDAYRINAARIPTVGPMPRIDHFEFPSQKAVKFVKEHRMAVTIQPGYAYADKFCLHTYERFLAAEDLDRIVPLRELADAGVMLLGSSDSPVQSINPYEQMRGMMDYYDREQSLTAKQAFETYTRNASSALAEAEGTLVLNGPATFFVSSADILHMTADEIISVRAEEVYINGKKMNKKKGTIGEFLRMLLSIPHRI